MLHAVGVLQKLLSLVEELVVVAESPHGPRGSQLHLHQKCSRFVCLFLIIWRHGNSVDCFCVHASHAKEPSLEERLIAWNC